MVYETDNTVFIVIKKIDIERIKQVKIPIYFLPWAGKLCCELKAKEFDWTSF